MINIVKVKKFCKDYTKIENYEDAVKDTSQTWVCHHILGEILSREQLLDHDFYYDVPPCMLKFVTRSEHRRLHMKGRPSPMKGRTFSEETRKKISEAKKGKKLSEEHRKKLSDAMKGHTLSEEHRKKLSDAMKGRTFSEEHRKKISEANKGENHPMYGQHLSDETRRKISDALKGHTLSEEHRRKISEALKRRKKF